MAQLPTRTHTQERPPERGESMRSNHWNTGRTGRPPKPVIRTAPAKIVNGKGRGGANRQALQIEGKTYSSLTAARRALGIGHDTLNNWIDTGKAQYVRT